MLNYYFTYFTIFSIIGYIYETIAMTLWSGKWENRGFLYGPVIPIYGVGATFGTILFSKYIPNYTPTLVFVIGFFASAILEYPTSVILEKLFHAYWWDYSSAPFNIQGRISLFSSMGFGLGAIVIIYVINPILLPLLESIDVNLLQLISLLAMMLFTIDATLTICVLGDFEKKVINLQDFVDGYMDEQVKNINPKGRNIKDALKFTKESIIDRGAEKLSESMDVVYHSAISRIKGFKSHSSETIHLIKNSIKLYNERTKNDKR